MALMPGAFFPGASVLTTLAVTADRAAWLPAANGRVLLSAHFRSTGTASGSLFKMATVDAANVTTGSFAYFAVATGNFGNIDMYFGPGGIDCTQGVSIDHQAGTFDCWIQYIDVT